jgi:hypothetical protein
MATGCRFAATATQCVCSRGVATTGASAIRRSRARRPLCSARRLRSIGRPWCARGWRRRVQCSAPPRLGIVLSAHTGDDGATIFQQACKLGLEGIVSKRLSAPYRSGPSRDWLKIKNPDSPAIGPSREGATRDPGRAVRPGKRKAK